MSNEQKIELIVTLDNGQLKVSTKEAEQSLSNIGKSAKTTGDQAHGGFSKMAAGISLISTAAKGFIGLQIVQFLFNIGKSAVKSAAELEKNRIAFETLLGSTSKAKALMSDINSMAAKTPFETSNLVEGAKRLIAFGESEKTVITTMTRLGDASMGNADIFDRLTLAYGKTQAKQKASMEELNMFTEAGVPILQALADQMSGGNTAAIMKMVEAGKVGFGDVKTALDNLTTGTGQFAGMMDKQSRSLDGMYSTFKDSLKMLGTEFGSLFDGVLKTILARATIVIDKIRSGLQSLRERQEQFEDSTFEFNARMAKKFGTQDKEGKYTYTTKANEKTGYKGGEKYTYYAKGGMEYVTHTNQSGYTEEYARELRREDNKKSLTSLPKITFPDDTKKDKSKEISWEERAQEYAKYAQTINDAGNSILSNLQNIFSMQDQIENEALEKRQKFFETWIEYSKQAALKEAGIVEETQAQKHAKELESLQRQYTQTSSLKKKQSLKERMAKEAEELQKAQIDEQAAKRQHALEVYMALMKRQLAIEQFNRNKEMQISQGTVQTLSGSLQAYMSAMSLPYPANLIAGAVNAALVNAFGFTTVGMIARQQPPMLAEGAYVAGSPAGTGVIVAENNRPELMLPVDNDAAMDKVGTAIAKRLGNVGPQLIVQGNIYGGRELDKVLKERFDANGWKVGR